MKYLSVSGATEVLSCAAHLSVSRSAVCNEMFFEFSMELRRFERCLGELTRDPVWRPFVAPMRRYRFEISAAPLAFNYLGSVGSMELIDRLGQKLALCAQVNPDFVESGRRLLGKLSALIGVTDAPLLRGIKEMCDVSRVEHRAVVVKEPRLVQMAAAVLKEESSLSTLRIVTVSELQGEQCFCQLFVIGPAVWYPDYVFTAPRAHSIHLLKYAWLADDWRPTAAFLVGQKGSELTTIDQRLIEALSDRTASTESSSLDPTEVLPRVDWDALKLRLAKGEGEGAGSWTEEVEYVEARLFSLEDGTAVALDCDESAKATTVDPDQVDGSPIKRIPVQTIDVGMFILVRTQGGGEYIAEVADAIMEDHAAAAREAQRRWKSLLRTAVTTYSVSHVVSELGRLGGTRPNETNVRNWMSYRTIKPKDYSDFQAIMQLVGLGHEIDDYWATMGMIDSAHRRAGHRIAKLLLSQVRDSDMNRLAVAGRMDFTLQGSAAGTLSALRVHGVYSEPVPVPVHRLGRLIDEGELYG